jgi:acyl-CoA synthetase (AMP-forming)/AMP-acid ligase II
MFPNMSAKYMSPEGKELGPGEAGELWLSGPNVFKGYWKNEAATKDAISEDGYFKTGDVGFQDENHNFFITDRVKVSNSVDLLPGKIGSHVNRNSSSTKDFKSLPLSLKASSWIILASTMSQSLVFRMMSSIPRCQERILSLQTVRIQRKMQRRSSNGWARK